MKTKLFRVANMEVAIGSEWDYYTPHGFKKGHTRVLAIEVAHILVEHTEIPEAGTGQRKWMSHDIFAIGATVVGRRTT